MAVDKLVDSAQLDADLTSVANAIRTKGGTSAQMAFPAGFVSAVQAIPTGITPTGTKSITENGKYDVTQYASASVSVPNTYSAGDEGKVVSNGALVAQTSDTVTTNDTYDTTLINSLTVNVSGGGGISTDDIAKGTEPSGAITLSSAVTEVATYVFYNKPIASVSGSAVTKVEASSFQKCASLTSVTFPNLTTITTSAFQDCTNLTSVSFPNLTALDAYAFSSSGLTSASFPLATSVGTGAFQSCQSLVSLSLPAVTKPGSIVFDCQHLASIDLTACTELVGGTFQQCYALEFIDFPSLTKIGNNAFFNARKLSTLVLRHTNAVVTLDGVNAFFNTPFRGYNSLSGTVYVPNALISSYQSASNWSSLYSGGYCTFAAIEGSQYE